MRHSYWGTAKIVSGADAFSKNGKQSHHLTSFLFCAAAVPSHSYFRMGTIPIAFSRQIFVVCRRGIGRGVCECCNCLCKNTDLILWSHLFFIQFWPPLPPTPTSAPSAFYFRMWMIPVTTIVSAAIYCAKILLYRVPNPNSLSVGVNLAVSITNCC